MDMSSIEGNVWSTLIGLDTISSIYIFALDLAPPDPLRFYPIILSLVRRPGTTIALSTSRLSRFHSSPRSF